MGARRARRASDYQGVAEFFNYLSSPEVQADWHQSSGYVPITTAAATLSREQGFYEENPGTDTAIKQLSLNEPTANSRGLRFGNFVQVRDIINEEFEDLWAGNKTAARRWPTPPRAATPCCAISRPPTSKRPASATPAARHLPGRRHRPSQYPPRQDTVRSKTVTFRHRWLPYALIAPQIIITLIFFIWPASQALYQSVLRQDAFGLKTEFVGLRISAAFRGSDYLDSFTTTAVFSALVAGLSMAIALLLAVMADRVIRRASVYQTLLIWPYAVAPAVAGVLWWFLFNPTIGIVAYALDGLGYDWNHYVDGDDAMALIVIAATWRQVSYNFLFFLAGLQAIPKSLTEAAAIDGAGPVKRFVTIQLPLLSPTVFFLIVVNVVYAFFDTFGVVHATTSGGPGQATNILVYKVWRDAFEGLNLGSSAAQSVILMVVVIALTAIQFRYIERRVEY